MSCLPSGTRVSVHYTDEAGQKIAHLLKVR
jgi:hypothetical protein